MLEPTELEVFLLMAGGENFWPGMARLSLLFWRAPLTTG
jgi:hypothetical protein